MPDWKAAIDDRLRGLPIAPAHYMEIAEEMSQHLQDRYDELRGCGATDTEAMSATIAELNDAEAQMAAELPRLERAPFEPVPVHPARRGGTMITAMLQDIKYATRTLRANIGFTTVAVLTLALGIGATTAIFSVLDAVMLRPLPYPDVDRIVVVSETTRSGQGMSVSWPNFKDWRDQNEVFEYFGVYRGMTVNLTGGDRPERLIASLASADVFKALGMQAATGRTFLPDEDRPGAARVAIISDRLWRSRFDADPGVVGTTVPLDGQLHTIVGIAPAGMRFPSRLTDVWLPLGLFVDRLPKDRGIHPGLSVVARLKPGVSLNKAFANMDALSRRLEQQYPMNNADHTVTIEPYYEQVVRNVRPALLTLIGAVGFVMLITCANLANLMLARADRRQRELAIRAALGAGRYRILQQLLIESLLTAIAGGALGALLAWWSVRAFVASRPATIPRIDLVAVDVRVLWFTAVVSIATGLVFGLLPALRGSSIDFLASLKTAARSSSGLTARRFRSALVVVEISLALVLAIGAGLAIRSFARLLAIDPGFNPAHVITMRVNLPNTSYPDLPRWLAFYDELIRRAGTLPGIDSVGLNSAIPLEGGGSESEVIYEGQPPPRSVHDEATVCLFQASTPAYFRAMGIQLLKGRPFTDGDTADTALVAIVDDTLVRRLFPTTDPIGKRIAFEFGGDHANPRPIWREIVGVVRHVHHYGLTGEPPFVQVYAPFRQLPIWFQQRRPSMALVARTALEPERLAASIRHEIAALDRDIPLYSIQTMDTYLGRSLEQPRINVTLLGTFSLLALVLAVLGIYGLLSYMVTLRRQEIGIRMALGATRGNVLCMIVRQGIALTATGLAIGLAGSWAVTALERRLLYGVSPHEPASFVSITLLLGTVGCLASCIPALRATHVDPVVTLRYE